MVDRPGVPDEEMLARRLRELGAQLDYPPTPDLARAVRSRLAAMPAPRPRWYAPQLLLAPRRLALLALLVAVLAGAALVLWPTSRNAVADWLGLPGLRITYVSDTPTAFPGTPTSGRMPSQTASVAATPTGAARIVSSATPGTIGQQLSLGQPMTLAAARGQVSFAVLTPTLPELGPANEVYLAIPPSDGQVSLVWRARAALPATAEPGAVLVLSQFRGNLAPGLWQKFVGPRTQIEYPQVNGISGFWITGGPHEFGYTDPSGQVRQETTRQVGGNVLLWQQGGVTFRLEGARSKEEALRIAASLR